MRKSGKFKNFLIFLVFVGIALVFWAIMTLDEDTQEKFVVDINVINAPDSVTFITDPPASMQVMVKDKGSHLLRHAFKKDLSLNLNFPDYSFDSHFVVSKSDLLSLMKDLFGNTVSISSLSVDSISCRYTTSPGKRVPVRVDFDVTAVPGMIVAPNPKVSNAYVSVFSLGDIDTVKYVSTDRIVRRNLDKTTMVETRLLPIAGVKIKPSKIKVEFTVEPLVKKESMVTVVPDNLPLGEDILFFPSKVKVVYYVPMSLYANEEKNIEVKASFREAALTNSDKVGIWVSQVPPYAKNVELLQDSVIYTLVK